MDLLACEASRLRFEAYVDGLVSVIGHADRVVSLHDYCTGLLLPHERKSVEPDAALTDPTRIAPKHQSLLTSSPTPLVANVPVVNAPWSDEAVLPKMEGLGPIEASIVDG